MSSRKYKITGESTAMAYDAKVGAVVELDIPPNWEATLIAREQLEIVPRKYQVVGGEFKVFDHSLGEKFEAGLTIEQESALIEGGHIKPVDNGPKKPKGGKKSG
jgi:hypothetical protein